MSSSTPDSKRNDNNDHKKKCEQYIYKIDIIQAELGGG